MCPGILYYIAGISIAWVKVIFVVDEPVLSLQLVGRIQIKLNKVTSKEV